MQISNLNSDFEGLSGIKVPITFFACPDLQDLKFHRIFLSVEPEIGLEPVPLVRNIAGLLDVPISQIERLEYLDLIDQIGDEFVA